mmetsp:Transcript_28768/g.45530  ORF Transcript_28768/g.45530 Transcript_28768/m.45530 type:complete len:448 (-) Transcript_28768:107-1450(-)
MAATEEKKQEDAQPAVEAITFSKDKQTNLEKKLFEHFTTHNLIQSEQTLPQSVLTELNDTFSSQNLSNIEQTLQFMYKNAYKSPLLCDNADNDKLQLLSKVPHIDWQLWLRVYSQSKANQDWDTRIKLWMLVQHQTVHLITNVYRLTPYLRSQLQHCIGYSNKKPAKQIPANAPRAYVAKMQVATANTDCIVAALRLKKAGYNPVVLNLANARAPAAATHGNSEGGTQEENIFKRTSLYLSLWPHRDCKIAHNPAYGYGDIFENEQKTENEQGGKQKQTKKTKKKVEAENDGVGQQESFYPMDDKFGGVYSRNVYVFRGAENEGYRVLPLNERCVIASIAVAARVHQSMGPLKPDEVEAYKNKIRTICRIAYENGHDSMVLGALGCGIFNNPPEQVAGIFNEVLMKEFNGCFAKVVFAILWDHNSRPLLRESFCKYFPLDDKIFDRV